MNDTSFESRNIELLQGTIQIPRNQEVKKMFLKIIACTGMISRLYNMCEYTWDPEKTWGIYFWEELIPPLVVYM